MKKVLAVITTGFASWGGLTNSYMNYYRVMDKEGLLIDIASMNDPEKELIEEIEANSGKYIKLPDKRKKPLRYLTAYAKICKEYDVVHIHGNSQMMAGELFLAKVNKVHVRIAHCHNVKGKHPILNVMLSPVFNASYTDGIACSAEAGRNLYKNKKHTVYNNVIDTEKFAFSEILRREIRTQYAMKDNTIVLGHVGKFVDQKNHLFLLDVFNEIYKMDQNVRLLLVGDGVLRDVIEKKISQYKLEKAVILAGMRSDTYRYFSAMDYYLFPSKFEGFGMALLEAEASGLKCFASSSVPSTANAADNVIFLPLVQKVWVDIVWNNLRMTNKDDRNNASAQARKKIIAAGCDAKNSGKKLRELYMKK